MYILASSDLLQSYSSVHVFFFLELWQNTPKFPKPNCHPDSISSLPLKPKAFPFNYTSYHLSCLLPSPIPITYAYVLFTFDLLYWLLLLIPISNQFSCCSLIGFLKTKYHHHHVPSTPAILSFGLQCLCDQKASTHFSSPFPFPLLYSPAIPDFQFLQCGTHSFASGSLHMLLLQPVTFFLSTPIYAKSYLIFSYQL